MNDEISLEDIFKFSFLMDIANAMVYLHKSHLHSHGRLKSSNCLVDAKWNIRVRFWVGVLGGVYFGGSIDGRILV